jgi:hypothetical protein
MSSACFAGMRCGMSMKSSCTAAAIARARALGQRLAREDTSIAPRIQNATDYPSYTDFLRDHRYYWETNRQFKAVWEPSLVAIAENYATQMSSAAETGHAQWDHWYNSIYAPVIQAMWQAWEEAVHLEAQFHGLRHDPVAEKPSLMRRILHGVFSRPRRAAPPPRESDGIRGFFG